MEIQNLVVIHESRPLSRTQLMLQQHKDLKLTQKIFFEEKGCTGVFGQKVTQNDFYYNKLTH